MKKIERYKVTYFDIDKMYKTEFFKDFALAMEHGRTLFEEFNIENSVHMINKNNISSRLFAYYNVEVLT
jgi:hypothetical protein